MRLPVLALAAAFATMPLPAQPTFDDSAAVRAMSEAERACRRDGGRTWGLDVCGPTIIVDARTRAFVAARAGVARGVERGRYPDSLTIANMGVTRGGERWAMILAPLPATEYERVKLLTHESFHRVQARLGLEQPNAVSAHLEERDGRYWLRLELRALAAALDTAGEARRSHLRDAMLFRAARHARYADAAALEDALERHEGLASYTGARLAGATAARVAAELREAGRGGGFARGFAYATGPALGVLLDAYSPGWRARRPLPASLAGALAQAARVEALDSRSSGIGERAEVRAAAYQGAALAREETLRDSVRAARLALLRARLVDGPVLGIPLGDAGVDMSFDPNAVTPLAEAGTVYTAGTFRGPWGVLVVERGAEAGALIDGGFRRLTVAAPGDSAARPLAGSGWRLELAAGWGVRPGARAGDLVVARVP